LLFLYGESLNRVYENRCTLLGRVLSRSDSGLSAEHETFSQRVAAQTVCTIHADTRHLSRSIQSREARVTMHVSMNTAHHVMLTWSDGYHLMNWINPQVSLCQFFDEGKFRFDRFLAQMGEVQVNITAVWAFECSALL